METLKIGSLFAGIGGIELGFQQAGFKTMWANEVDKDACITYRYNFPNVKLIEEDIRDLDVSKLEYVDVLSAGFPCQPFSVCGNKKGFNDERGNLFFEIMRIVDAIQPPIIFLENVANLTEHDNGRTFNIIHNELISREYFIRYLVADACDYGVPQHRTRTYIIAFKSQEACERFVFPEKCNLDKRIFDIIDKSVKIEEKHYLRPGTYQYNKMVEAINDEKQIYRFSDYGIQSSKEGISFTLKANMGTWKDRIPIIKDNYGIRKITPYEALALQGFPDTFGFGVISSQAAYKQIGNSVCVPVIRKIAERIKIVLNINNNEGA